MQITKYRNTNYKNTEIKITEIKSRIRETPTLSTDADSRTNTNLKRLVDFFSFFKGWLEKKNSLPLFFPPPPPPPPSLPSRGFKAKKIKKKNGQNYRNTNTEIQMTKVHKYKLQDCRNTSYTKVHL